MLDPSTSPLAPGASVSLRGGSLEGGRTLSEALDLAGERLDPDLGDGFTISIDAQGAVEVAVGSEAALNRVRTVIATSATIECDGKDEVRTVTDAPRIALRSIHECFYGERWAPEDRLAVMRLAAEAGANAYVYGPSADRRTGGLWRELYEGRERAVLVELAKECRAVGVEPIWRISPAAPLEPTQAIRMSDPEEFAALVQKARHAIELGFERILIAFDDLTAGLDEETAARFEGADHPMAAAHADAIRRLGEEIGHERLLACPLHYWGIEPSPYRREFGRGFPSEVPVVWTGPAVISEEITASDAAAVAEEVGHPLWLWDNYPVNDWDMDGISALPLHARPGLDNLVIPRRLPLAPISGRDPRLGDVVMAMGGNLALDPWTGLPAALTLLDFAWAGAAYDAEESWRSAVERLDVDVDALALLADSAGPGSGVLARRPSAFAVACASVFVAEDPFAASLLVEVESVVNDHVGALADLRAAPSRLTRELQPWLVELGRQCQLALLGIAALRASVGEKSELAAELTGALNRRSIVAVGSGMGRALAEYARGLVAGGTPQIDVPDAVSFGH
ncbi:beta-N-acetylglucosaminidase domain-containing protein [Microbacterium sp.]|uniref:beta-N-acetylglucosaminidase domain-containing protein n=1 Tax=Microbacterium sp. TaxID=51671 RepID=UPI003F96C484